VCRERHATAADQHFLSSLPMRCTVRTACMQRPISALPALPRPQAFAPFPAERLDEIGGGKAAYIQDPVARRELGEARKARALEPGMFGGWCQQVRAKCDGGPAENSNRVVQCLPALHTPVGILWCQQVRAKCDGGPAENSNRVVQCLPALQVQPAAHLLASCGMLCLVQVASQAALCIVIFPAPQAVELISSTDALAITEHGQFCRSPDACQVRLSIAAYERSTAADVASACRPVGCRCLSVAALASVSTSPTRPTSRHPEGVDARARGAAR